MSLLEVSALSVVGAVYAGSELLSCSAFGCVIVLSGHWTRNDCALAAMLTSYACEPLLTSLGAGGYMLVVEPGEEPVLLDFFVEAPGRGLPEGDHSELIPVPVSFGDAVQEFHVGPASVGTFGMPAGVCEAARRFGRRGFKE